MEKVFASIITIGDELLIGQVIDSNSAWIAQELNKAGIAVRHRTAVGDVAEDIVEALDEESKKSSLILITGGLGPTSDDITKPLLCSYFGGKMLLHEPTLLHLTVLFEKILKRPMIERNRQQAMLPDVCTVLTNRQGTAPGMLFRKNGKIFISMPGVPQEMQDIMTNEVMPLLPQFFHTGFIEHKTLLTAGIGESYLADMIQDIETSLPAHIKLAYLPNYGMVRLRLTGAGYNQETLLNEIGHYFRLLVERSADYLVIDEDLPLEMVVGKLLKEKGKTMATAESCTGGYIAHLMTIHAGSSAYFTGSVVSYANVIKHKILGVEERIMQTVGVVSEETVRQMATSILDVMDTDYSIAVSGIMGPGGATNEKPVGMVWIAAGCKTKVTAKEFRFRFDRKKNIELTAMNALNMLRLLIIENG